MTVLLDGVEGTSSTRRHESRPPDAIRAQARFEGQIFPRGAGLSRRRSRPTRRALPAAHPERVRARPVQIAVSDRWSARRAGACRSGSWEKRAVIADGTSGDLACQESPWRTAPRRPMCWDESGALWDESGSQRRSSCSAHCHTPATVAFTWLRPHPESRSEWSLVEGDRSAGSAGGGRNDAAPPAGIPWHTTTRPIHPLTAGPSRRRAAIWRATAGTTSVRRGRHVSLTPCGGHSPIGCRSLCSNDGSTSLNGDPAARSPRP